MLAVRGGDRFATATNADLGTVCVAAGLALRAHCVCGFVLLLVMSGLWWKKALDSICLVTIIWDLLLFFDGVVAAQDIQVCKGRQRCTRNFVVWRGVRIHS